MEQLLLKLKALKAELVESYEEYLECQYQAEVDFISHGVEGPDFELWTDRHCLKFEDWIKEKADDDLVEEFYSVATAFLSEAELEVKKICSVGV